jgi:hypothetical protein
MIAVSHFILGAVAWFALLCAIAGLCEIGRAKAQQRRRTMRQRIDRHVMRRG